MIGAIMLLSKLDRSEVGGCKQVRRSEFFLFSMIK